MKTMAEARVAGAKMALSLGVRVFLYADPDGLPVFHAILPAAGPLTLVETFGPPPPSTPSAFADVPKLAPAG